jgi:hypothetical protein
MQTKGKGSKVLVAICKDRSRLLTFPRGDSPPLKAVYVTRPVRAEGFEMTKPVDVEIWLEDKWLAENGVGYPNVTVEQKEENVDEQND